MNKTKLVGRPPVSREDKGSIKEELQALVNNSKLASLVYNGRHFYIADYYLDNTAFAGFDCDDYAEAMVNYLNNKWAKSGDARITYLYVEWRKRSRTGDKPSKSKTTGRDAAVIRHAMVLVRYKGKFYVIDP